MIAKNTMATMSLGFIGPSSRTWTRSLATGRARSRYSGLKVSNRTKVTKGS